MALTDQKNVHGENVKRHAAPRAKHVEGCARPTDTDGIRRLRPTPLTRLNTLRGGHPNPPPTPISRRLPLAKQPRLERAAYSLSTHTPISSYAKKKKKRVIIEYLPCAVVVCRRRRRRNLRSISVAFFSSSRIPRDHTYNRASKLNCFHGSTAVRPPTTWDAAKYNGNKYTCQPFATVNKNINYFVETHKFQFFQIINRFRLFPSPRSRAVRTYISASELFSRG